MEFTRHYSRHDSGLLLPVKATAPEPTPPPEPPRGEFLEPWPDGYCRHEGEAWLEIKTGTPFDLKINVHSIGPYMGGRVDCGDVMDRIVACVNACQGLSNETLQAVVRGDLILRPE